MVAKLWGEGLTVTQSVLPLNEWLRSRGYPEITRSTLTEDRKRLGELARETHPYAQEEHSEKMRHLTSRLYERLNEAGLT
jgi:hypothetical protein